MECLDRKVGRVDGSIFRIKTYLTEITARLPRSVEALVFKTTASQLYCKLSRLDVDCTEENLAGVSHLFNKIHAMQFLERFTKWKPNDGMTREFACKSSFAKPSSPKRKTYAKTYVLILGWADTDLQIPSADIEDNKIRETLRLIGSNPVIEHFLIPSYGAQAALENKTRLYETMLSSEDLLVLYHFEHGRAREKGFFYSGHRNAPSFASVVIWAPIQKILQRMQADKLVFTFSCHSGAVVTFDEKVIVGNETGGRVDIITACTSDQLTFRDSNGLDFMKNLRREIIFRILYLMTTYQSSMELHSSMLRRLMLARAIQTKTINTSGCTQPTTAEVLHWNSAETKLP